MKDDSLLNTEAGLNNTKIEITSITMNNVNITNTEKNPRQSVAANRLDREKSLQTLFTKICKDTTGTGDKRGSLHHRLSKIDPDKAIHAKLQKQTDFLNDSGLELEEPDGMDDVINEIKKSKHKRKSSQEILKTAYNNKLTKTPSKKPNLNRSMIQRNSATAKKQNLNRSMVEPKKLKIQPTVSPIARKSRLGKESVERTKITNEYDKILDELAVVFGENLENFDEDSKILSSSGASCPKIQ